MEIASQRQLPINELGDFLRDDMRNTLQVLWSKYILLSKKLLTCDHLPQAKLDQEAVARVFDAARRRLLDKAGHEPRSTRAAPFVELRHDGIGRRRDAGIDQHKSAGRLQSRDNALHDVAPVRAVRC